MKILKKRKAKAIDALIKTDSLTDKQKDIASKWTDVDDYEIIIVSKRQNKGGNMWTKPQKKYLDDLEGRLNTKIDDVKTELKQDINDLRTELKGDIRDLRAELKGDMNDLRTELKGDINELKELIISLHKK